jgi:N-acetylmuramoyl-L-alanine amidase
MKRIARSPAGAAANRLRGEKGIIDRDGYQLDTRHPAQAAYPRIKVLVIHYTADNFDVSWRR